MQSILRVDALYYHAARAAYSRAVAALPKASRKRRTIERLQGQFESVECFSDAAEPIAIRLEREEEDLHSLYAPIFEGFALTHLLCAASLEAHINDRGFVLLSGTMWEEFEGMSLEAKWLFLSRICGRKGFTPGDEPFRNFAQLIKYRNKLTHYKPRSENWKPPGIPDFIETLGLSEEASSKSLKTVKQMILNLASQLRLEKPYWVRAKEWSFFLELEFGTREERRQKALGKKYGKL